LLFTVGRLLDSDGAFPLLAIFEPTVSRLELARRFGCAWDLWRVFGLLKPRSRRLSASMHVSSVLSLADSN
jgi:hypothetical protein